MTRCQRCGAGAEDGAAFCPQCGAAAEGGSAASSATYPLLARANLLRMRGRWDEAAELCTEAMRLEPRNASAHSLLGDIHENQGHLEEAVHWYDLALGLNPRSEADAAKRARVQELLEARRRRAEWQAAIQSAGRPPGAAAAMRETVQRVLAVAGAAVCAGILMTAVVLSATRNNQEAFATGEPPSTPSVHGPRIALPVALSQRERRLWDELNAARQVSTEHGQIAVMTIDPVTDQLALTMVLPSSALRASTLQEIRDAIERDCYWVAHQVHLRDRALTSIRVYAFGDTAFSAAPSGQDRLFAATLRPENLVLDPAMSPPTRDDLASFFENPWWNPLLEG